ncbi:glycosyl hydrolase family 2 [Chitinophaga niastensis]|uniref:Glycosyl hydrolase family 2 n=1 Tax=Chitinophaga niastensis TaxID=536980 RepID=A0A2P8HA21_CHINA|nr:sugar-binding domain-containing protein [Chitinophaga niastensis]PSL43068.1 glycosyl hydrolase family 2 [Chitinophaga niastensis]
MSPSSISVKTSKQYLTKQSFALLLRTAFLCWIFFGTSGLKAADTLSLAGKWAFQADPEEEGLAQNWANKTLTGSIMLPGSTDEIGIGNQYPIYKWSNMPKAAGYPDSIDIGSFTRIHKYIGIAWYQREIEIPASWKGKHITLTLERVLWSSRIFIDGRETGKSVDYLSTPHIHSIGALTPGKHTLTIRIDNREIYSIGKAGHSYCNHMQSIWNGVAGRMELTAREMVAPVFIRVFPSFKDRRINVATTLQNDSHKNIFCPISIVIREKKSGKVVANYQAAIEVRVGSSVHQQEIYLSATPLPWDEFTPNLYTVEVSIYKKNASQKIVTDVGFRDIGSNGTHITVNGKSSFIRFSHEGMHFPLTGYPATDIAYWLRVFKVYKDHGLNGVRFHSCTPPEAAFQAADQLGLYLQVEFFWQDSWMGNPSVFGTGKNKELDAFACREFRNALDAYGNHPSMMLVLYGNELGVDFKLCSKWLGEEKAYDPRHLYAVGAAHEVTPNDDFVEYGDKAYDKKTTASNDWDYQSYYTSEGYTYSAPAIKRGTKPDFVHEMGQQVVHPLWSEIESYKKGPFRLCNLAYFRELASRSGVDKQDTIFQKASGQMNRIFMKSDIEANLRSADAAGYSMLSMVDYPGQGEAYVGWVDACYKQKNFLTSEKYRQYGGHTVPLIRTPKFVWQHGETFHAEVEIANYGPADLVNKELMWRFKDEKGKTVAQGILATTTIPQGSLTAVGEIETLLTCRNDKGEHLNLTLSLKNTDYHNEWDIWVLPEIPVEKGFPANVIITTKIDEALAALKKRQSVLLFANKLGDITNTMYCRFKPVFWSAVWFTDDYCQTLGAVINQQHPSLDRFPTNDVMDWQWLDVFEIQGHGFNLQGLPLNYQPIIQPVNDFHFGNKLGLLFELKTKDNGKLLVCGFNLTDDLEHRPAARQLKHSLLSYVSSARFNPMQEVTETWLSQTFADNYAPIAKPAEFENAFLYVKAGSHHPLVKGNTAWNTDVDAVVKDGGYDYKVVCDGVWKDENGAAWYANDNLHIEIMVASQKRMRLKVKLHDWNQQGCACVVTCEDHSPVTVENQTGGKWVTFPITRENCLDGKLILDIKKKSGTNIMVTDIALTPGE